MNAEDALKAIYLRLRLLSRDGMKPEQAAWLDKAQKVAKDALGDDAKEADDSNGLSKFLRIADNLQLIRFRGDKFVKLVGRTPAHDGNLPCCFEIEIDKGEGHVATCYRNGAVLFELRHPFSTVAMEEMAVSCLKRWVKRSRAANHRSKRSAKRKREAARLAAEAKAKEA